MRVGEDEGAAHAGEAAADVRTGSRAHAKDGQTALDRDGGTAVDAPHVGS